MRKDILIYKCYIRAIKSKMKLCGVYHKKDFKLIRILGESKLVYSIIIKNNGEFECNCQYFTNVNKNICKHIFLLFFNLFKIFKKWTSSHNKIYLNRYSHHTLVNFDESFLDGKLNEVSLLLLNKNIKLYHFKLMDQRLYELDNYYLKIKNNRNYVFDKYYSLDNKVEQCSICLNHGNIKFKCPKCKKKLHLSCLNEWIKINHTCPNCRNDIEDYKDFISIINSQYHNINRIL
jgi:hypothetical protein